MGQHSIFTSAWRNTRIKMKKYTDVLVLCLLFITLTSGQETKNKSHRSPKLFFVSSKSTTSTVSTSSFCYSTINAAVTACGRKKRAIITEEVFDVADNIKAANADNEAIISGLEQPTSPQRQGKFLLYWLTTTSTSTLTSYTATTTLGVSCIPSNLNAC